MPTVPIYIQEKIHPQSIIDDLLAQAAKPGSSLREAATAYQLNVFADFNGGPDGDFDQKVDFYQPNADDQPNWSNRLDPGRLAAGDGEPGREGRDGGQGADGLPRPALRHQVRLELRQRCERNRDVKDGKANDLTAEPEQIRAFRDTWKLGIHSYLAYLHDRLSVATSC